MRGVSVVCVLALATALSSCKKEEAGTGNAPAEAPAAAAAPKEVGPDGPDSIAVKVGDYDTSPATVEKGKALFASKGCIACHKMGGGKLVGPDLKGVTTRRTATWIARMIVAPERMVKEDPQARKLFAEMMTPMANQNVNQDTELPALMGYLKSEEK